MDDLPAGTNVRTIRAWLNDVKRLAERSLYGAFCHSSEDGHHVTFPSGQELFLYQLTTSFEVDATTGQWIAEGKPVVLSPNDVWAMDTTADAQEIYLPAGFQNGSDESYGMVPYRETQRVYVTDYAGVLECVSPPLDRWRVMLKTALAPLSTADVYLLPWVSGSLQVDTGVIISSVQDTRGFRGRAYKSGSPPVDGAVAVIQYFPDANRWEFDWVQPHVKCIRCQADGDVSGTGSFNIDNVTKMFCTDEALYVSADGTAPTQLDNDDELEFNDDDWILAFWDDTDELFRPTKGFDGESGASVPLHLVKVQSYTNQSPATLDDVSVKDCDINGVESGSAYNVKILPDDEEASYLFPNKIIGWEYDRDGNKVITTKNAYGPLFGTVWTVSSDAAIPAGWSLYSVGQGRFPLFYEAGHPTWGALGATGGDGVNHTHDDHLAADIASTITVADHLSSDVAAAIDDHDLHCHGADCSCVEVASGTGEYCWEWVTGHTLEASVSSHAGSGTPVSHTVSATATDLSHSTDGHMPDWICLKAIIRDS